MISEKQIQANRQNAQKGGVKTAQGKAVSCYNALKHGLLSQEVLLDTEYEQSLLELGKRLRMELAPASEIELILVERIIANTWRLKRALQVEKEMIESDQDSNILGARNLGGAFSSDFNNADTYGKFIRYEASIERGIYKALHELQRIQAARLGEKPSIPVAVDVTIDKYEE